MKPIIKKACINKRNNQMNISISRRSLPSKIRYSNNLLFKIEAFHKDKGVK